VLDFAGFFRNSRDIGFITDLRGAILSVTAGTERALDYAASELVGLDLPHLDELGDLRRFFEKNGAPESRLNVGFHLRAKSGRVLAIGSVVSSLRDEAGKPIGWFFACQDLRGAVAESRTNRSILDALLDSIGAALWSFDGNGTVLTWGRACEEVFGVPRGEAEGKLPVVRLFPTPEIFREVVRTADEQGRYSGEVALVGRGGLSRPSQLTVTPLSSGGLALGYTAVSFDLSERKRLEGFQRVLFERAGEAIIVVDADLRRIIDTNERASELLGHTREEFLTLGLADIRPVGEDPARVAAITRTLDETGRFEGSPEPHRRKDGVVILCELNVRRVTVGGRRYSVSILRDLTERLKAEEFFRVLFQKSSDAIHLVDGRELRIVEANEALCRMLGYTREEMLSLRVPDLVPQDKRHLIQGVRDSVSGPQAFRRDRRMLLRKDGTTVATEHSISRIEIGGHPYFLACSRDLTEQEKAARELEEAKAFLEHVQEGASDGIAILDENWVYVSVNRRMLEIHGRPVEYFVGQSARERIPPEQLEAYEEIYRRLIRGEKIRIQSKIRNSAGRELTLDVSSSAIDRLGKKYFVALVRDVTEQAQAEETLRRGHDELERRVAGRTAELRESEERYRTLAENAGVGFWQITPDGRTIYANPTMAALLGVEGPRDLEQGTFHRFFTPETLEVIKREHVRRQAGLPSTYEVEIVQPGGARRRAMLYGAPMMGPDGKLQSMIATVIDITERERAEEALRESEERYRLVARATDTGIWDWEIETNRVYFSPIWKRQIGYDDGELPSRYEEWEKRLHPEDRDRILGGLRRHVERGTPEFEHEFRLRHRDGTWRTILAQATVLRDPGGRPFRVVGTHVDVTERRQAEEALRESEERFRGAFSHGGVGMALVSPEGRFLQVNRALCEMLGYHERELLSDSFPAITHPDDCEKSEELRVRLISGEADSSRLEKRYFHRDGHVVWVDLTTTLIRDARGEPRYFVSGLQDITERKRAEEDLERRVEERTALLSAEIAERRRAEERLKLYREIFANANEGVAILDARGFYLEQNEAHRKLLGFSDEDLRGETPALNFGDAAFAKVVEELGRRGAYRGEAVSRTKDGGEVLLEISLFTVRDSSGKPLCHVGIKRDISERKRAEDALRDSEERWRSVVTHAPDFILTVDREGRILSLNRTVPGITMEQALGSSVLDYSPPSQRPIVKAGIERVFETGEPVGYETESVGPNGTKGWYASRVGPIKRGTQVVGATIIATDITGRKLAEEALRFQKTLLESQGEAAIDGILVVSSEGKMISFNRRFLELWEIPPEVVESRSDEKALRSILDRVADPQGFLARVRHLYEHPGEESHDEIVLKDGRTFDRYSAPVRSAEGVHYGRVWYFRDVTGRKRTEDKLRRAAEETRRAYDDLKQAQEQLIRTEKLASIGMLVSGVAHEINNPLNVMYGNLQLLAEQCARMGPEMPSGLKPGVRKIRSMLRDGLRAAEHARNIVEEFRSFARDTRTAELVDLNVCLEEMASLAGRELGARVRLVKRLRRVPPVRCFRGQMNQLFLNLLKNAGEAIEKKGTVTVRTHRKNGHVIVEVADTGRGIPDEVRRKLFEPFFTTKPVGKGLGLGLSISAMIVQNHGGRISVKSRPGCGSVFRVELPIKS
jgi:two-component system NtrC family sensor kinase